jgi:hypothetical protein
MNKTQAGGARREHRRDEIENWSETLKERDQLKEARVDEIITLKLLLEKSYMRVLIGLIRKVASSGLF